MKFNKEFTKKDLEALEEIIGKGISQKSAATLMGISEPTLELMIKHRDAVKHAVDKGRAKSEEKVVQTAYDLATSGDNPFMTRFWCMAKLGWRTTTQLELITPGGEPTSIEDMTPEQRQKRIDDLLRLRERLSGRVIKDVTPIKEDK